MAEKNLGKVAVTTGGTYASSKAYDKLTIVNHNGASWISKTAVPAGNAPSESSSYWQLLLGASVPRIAMTSTSASINPNTFYVWGEVASLDITLNEGASAEENRYMFQFRNPKSGATVLTLPDDILWSVDTELGDDGLPLFGKGEYTRIEIIEGLASVKKWALPYIIFADAEVERVLMANGLGDGTGITKQEAKGVTSMGQWFYGNTEVVSFDELRYFKSLTSVTAGIFRNCTNLISVSLPSSLTAIVKNMFQGASKLSSVNTEVPVTSVDESAFYECANLGSFDLSEVVTIGDSAFYMSGLKELYAPKLEILQQPDIYNSAFANSKLERITSLGNVKYIPQGNVNFGCFKDCANLREVLLPETLEEIRDYAFQNTGNVETMNLPHSLKVIKVKGLPLGSWADGITVNLPNLTSIGQVFATLGIKRVESLGAITILGVTSGNVSTNGTFRACVQLEFVRLPQTLTSIGVSSFYQCSSLETLVIEAETPPSVYDFALRDTLIASGTGLIYVPDASVEAYKTATNWLNYAAQIKGISELPTE